MAELFASLADASAPSGCGPKRIEDVLGQDHLLGPDGPLGRMLAAKKLASLILWGPPGCGKTTIARLLAETVDLHFEPLSAVFSGVADLRKVFEAARQRRKDGKGTLLFVDEIHRFNRAQQDGFLPYVEDGTVTLIGATTENPSFELNAALLSRCQVLVLRRLDDAALEHLLERAEAALGKTLPVDEQGRAGAVRHGRRRRPLPDHAGRAAGAAQGEGAAAAGAAGDAAAEARAALRQGAGGALQPDQRAAQVAARLRRRCGALLFRAHARWRRGPAIHRPPAGALRRRGYRHGRSQCADPDARRVGHLRPARLARRRARDRAGGDLSRHRAEIERGLRRLRRRQARRPRSTAR